jgi:hypothetical protein
MMFQARAWRHHGMPAAIAVEHARDMAKQG